MIGVVREISSLKAVYFFLSQFIWCSAGTYFNNFAVAEWRLMSPSLRKGLTGRWGYLVFDCLFVCFFSLSFFFLFGFQCVFTISYRDLHALREGTWGKSVFMSLWNVTQHNCARSTFAAKRLCSRVAQGGFSKLICRYKCR